MIFLLGALAVSQGQALRLDVPDEPGLEAVVIEWNEHLIPFAKDSAGWFTLVGIDLDASPGVQMAEMTRTYHDGRIRREVRQIDVADRWVKTSRLPVAPRYV